MTPADLITNARAALLVTAPFWGVLALRLHPVADPTIKTMATNGRDIKYNPDYAASLTKAHLRSVIAHEVMHCAALHHTRRGTRDPRRWNVACDLAINPLLTAAGFVLPKGALTDPQYAGMSAEQIFAKLPDNTGGSADADQDTDGGGMGAVEDAPDDDQDDPATQDPSGQSSPSATAIASQEQDWQVAVAQATATAKAMGIGAGDTARAIKDQVAPRLDWQAVLRQFFSQAAKSDYAWTPPNRRHIAAGLYLPSLRSESLGPVVVAVDTSGSINAPTLATFAAEIMAILDEAQPEAVHVVYCDHAVQAAQSFAPGDDIVLTPKGGGGTAFAPVFAWIQQAGIDPVCTIYLTDLHSHDFGPEPDHPVLWVTTGLTEAPFGQIIPYST